MEVPDGWLQLIRGPRPKSERWPLKAPQKPHASSSSDVHGMKSTKTSTDAVRRVSPDAARATAQEKARKLEKALEVMSDVDGPTVEALRAELKKVQNAVSVQVRTAVGRDRCATSCRARVIDRPRPGWSGCGPRRPSVQTVKIPDHRWRHSIKWVNLLQSERDALAKELTSDVRHRGRCPSSGQETGGCKVDNFASGSSRSCPFDAEARAQRHDDSVAGSSGQAARRALEGRFASRHGVGPNNVGKV